MNLKEKELEILRDAVDRAELKTSKKKRSIHQK